MKKVLLLVSAFVISASALMAQKKVEDVVKFKEMTFDFGKIKQGVPVTHEFGFSNISNDAIIIESATASCGCTTPQWPMAPVVKKKDDKITAGFNAANPGPFNKTITVKIKDVDTPVLLTIKGEVLTADAYANFEKEKGKAGGR